MSLAITQSDALIYLAEGDSPITVWAQTGKPYMVARKKAIISWVHVTSEQPAGATLAGFDVVLFVGEDPDVSASRVTDLVAVGQSTRSTEIVFAPLATIPAARAAVRARYSGAVTSAWRILPGSLAIEAQVFPLGGGARATISANVGLVLADATGTGSIEVPKTFSVLKLTTNYPARVRMYVASADRTADADRPVTEDPEGDHGCILECVTDASLLTMRLLPAALATRRADGTTAFLAVQNLDTEARVLTVSLEFLSLE